MNNSHTHCPPAVHVHAEWHMPQNNTLLSFRFKAITLQSVSYADTLWERQEERSPTVTQLYHWGKRSYKTQREREERKKQSPCFAVKSFTHLAWHWAKNTAPRVVNDAHTPDTQNSMFFPKGRKTANRQWAHQNQTHAQWRAKTLIINTSSPIVHILTAVTCDHTAWDRISEITLENTIRPILLRRYFTISSSSS